MVGPLVEVRLHMVVRRHAEVLLLLIMPLDLARQYNSLALAVPFLLPSKQKLMAFLDNGVGY